MPVMKFLELILKCMFFGGTLAKYFVDSGQLLLIYIQFNSYNKIT